MGKNVGPLIGNFESTSTSAPRANPDVETIGWWAQAGLNLTKEFSVWGFYGNQKPDKTDAGRARHGPHREHDDERHRDVPRRRLRALGRVDQLQDRRTPTAFTGARRRAAASRRPATSKSDQYMLTANYFF